MFYCIILPLGRNSSQFFCFMRSNNLLFKKFLAYILFPFIIKMNYSRMEYTLDSSEIFLAEAESRLNIFRTLLKERSLVMTELHKESFSVTKVKAFMRKIVVNLERVNAPTGHVKQFKYMLGYKTKGRKLKFRGLVLAEFIIFSSELEFFGL